MNKMPRALKNTIKVNRLMYKSESDIVHYQYKEKMHEVVGEFADIILEGAVM